MRWQRADRTEAISEGTEVTTLEYSFAFQPIVDTNARKIIAYEALIRGSHHESARQILAQVRTQDRYGFEHQARLVAIALAAGLGIDCHLSLNLLPRAVRTSASMLEGLVDMAERCGLPVNRLILEVTESEAIDDHARFARLFNEYRDLGIKVAFDDFGAGYSGLNLLAEFQPDMIKLDMNLVRGIESRGPRQAIVRGIVQVCLELGIDVIAEGVETVEEYAWFECADVRLFQGYLFARPAFELLPTVLYPVHKVQAVAGRRVRAAHGRRWR